MLNKTALVTGASGGLGREIVHALGKAGCKLILVGRNESKLKELASEVKSLYGGCPLYFSVDFCSSSDMDAFFQHDLKVDILVNCAGIFPIKALDETTLEDYLKCLDINLKIPFFLCKWFSTEMKLKGWGRIVNIASSSAYNGSPETPLYCASKHALLGFTRSLYLDLKPYNIRVYCVSPGSIQTEMGRGDTQQKFNTFLDPKEVAEYITYIMKFDNEMIPEEIRLSRMVIK